MDLGGPIDMKNPIDMTNPSKAANYKQYNEFNFAHYCICYVLCYPERNMYRIALSNVSMSSDDFII